MRLVSSKQLFLHGYNHYKIPGDLNRLISIISIDQGIESFLLTTISELGATLKNPYNATFKNKWDTANEKIKLIKKQELPLATEVFSIHKARNNAQHDGIIPSDSSLERAVIYTEVFLKKSYILCFNLNFDKISLSQLIKDRKLKTHMTLIEKKIADEKYRSATYDLVKTFNLIYRTKGIQDKLPLNDEWDFMSNLSIIAGQLFKKDIKDFRDHAYTNAEYDFRRLLEKMNENINILKEWISIISLGVNIQEYLFFRKNTPTREYTSTVNGKTKEKFKLTGKISYSKENCLRLFNFVYNTIIALESF